MAHLTRVLGALLAAAVLLGLPGAAAAKTEIQWWHGNTGAIGDRIAELAKKFNEGQPDYEVKPIYKGSYPETLAALIAAYRSKTQPHMALIFEVGTQTMLASGAVVPVFQLMKEQGVSIEGADFIAPVKSYYSKDGQLYSMPFASDGDPVLQQGHLQEGRARPEQGAGTIDEIEAVSKKVARPTPPVRVRPRLAVGTMVEQMHAWHDKPFATRTRASRASRPSSGSTGSSASSCGRRSRAGRRPASTPTGDAPTRRSRCSRAGSARSTSPRAPSWAR
jgi:sn-glycerol 3-phosphate transport system substrate-binding protein